MYRQEKSHSYYIPILHEHFCFHGKNSGFLDSGQKHGGKHSFTTLTPLKLIEKHAIYVYMLKYHYRV
jgi:hypothetical protein